MGVATGIQSIFGETVRGNGTSFSSPLIAGSVASLWQAYPDLPAKEMINWVRQSGNRYKNPDITFGYGVPNFVKAYWNITDVPVRFVPGQLEIYPNPAQHYIMIKLPDNQAAQYELRFYDLSGKLIRLQQISIPGEVDLPETLLEGMYILEIKSDRGIYRTRLIKQ